jgi:beta-glucosidase/6-phospho-beta-glucosidase/beta-galactosidase/ABC-type amino acid transport substrate-binding protein
MNWKAMVGGLAAGRSLPSLPKSFLFGVATADHQCEAYRPGLDDIQDVWECTRGLVRRGRATDFWNRYAEDVELARQLGCNAFRFSTAWSRVEPEPGNFDVDALEHYRRLVAAIRAAGMQPILTLHHFTWPVHIQERGGMISDGFPDLFARYAAQVVEQIGQEVRLWVTFNEPSQLLFGYIKPWWEPNYPMPPGLPVGTRLEEQVTAMGQLIRNLFLAHTQARRIIRESNAQAMVGTNPLLLGLPIWLQRLINWNATRVRSPQDLARHVQRHSQASMLERGEVDLVVAALTQNVGRAKQVMFSESYLVAGQQLLVKAASPVRGAQDLADKGVAVVRSSTAEEDIRELLPQARPRVTADYGAAMDALEREHVEAILADDTILRGLAAQHPDRYRMVGPPLTREPYAAAVSPGQHELLDVVDNVVHHFKESGAWADSHARHLERPAPEPPPSTPRSLADLERMRAQAGLPEPGPPPPAEPGSGLRRIQERGYLIAGVRDDLPGLGYRDLDTGEYSGLEIDLARAVAERIFGDTEAVRFRATATQGRIGLLRSPLRWLDPLRKQLRILSTMMASDWWHLGMAGRLPEFLCPSECVGQQDFAGLDYYWGIRKLSLHRIGQLMDTTRGRFDRAPVWPAALYERLRHLGGVCPDLPLLILENGSVDVADGVERAGYIRSHMQEVQRAARDGVKVTGYICWSITSNREWGHPFGANSDFGIHHIELDSDPQLRRTATPAAPVYQDIIARRGV